MTQEEFRKYVIEEAKKHLFSNENVAPASSPKPISESENKPAPLKESISPSDIKTLADEIKKINKKIDLRNPLISEGNESLVETIMGKTKPLQERQLDVDSINKNKDLNHKNESEKAKWSRMIEHKKFSEEDEK